MKRNTLTLVSILIAILSAHAQTKWFATPGAPTTGGGTSWADPKDLQSAIAAATAGDSVFAAQGTYMRGAASFSMKEAVKIYGGFAGTETSLAERNLNAGYSSILNGNSAGRVIENLNNGVTIAAVLDGFTVINGNAAYGGGLFNNKVSPTVSNCVFLNNFGGGVYNATSDARIINCVFSGNYNNTFLSHGGGVTCAGNNNVIISGCVFIANRGYTGGAIYIDDLGQTPTTIINCTMWGNTTEGPGAGGIYCQSRSAPNIRNCIIWNNGTALRLSGYFNPNVTNNIIQGGYRGNWNVDPLFVNTALPSGADGIWGTADDGLKLQTGSIAYNTGGADITGLLLPSVDIAGNTRIQGNRIDIGAYESAYSCSGFTTLHVDASVASSGDGTSWSTAFKTLDEALLASSRCTDVSEILVAKGIYVPALRTSFALQTNVNIYGGFPEGGGSFAQRDTKLNTSTLNRSSGNSIIFNDNIKAPALLDGFTISDGIAGTGAGMYNSFSSPTFNNCVFANNGADGSGGAGGAVYNSNSYPLFTKCMFTNNSASTTNTGGGGAAWNSSGKMIFNQCVFENNTSRYGGAVYNYAATLVPSDMIINNSVFSGNHCTGDGAGIASLGTSMVINNTTFVNNHADGGGAGIDQYVGSVNVTNCIFWNNTAANNPDIWHEKGTATITNSFMQATWPGANNIAGTNSPVTDITTPAGADGIWFTADDGLRLPAGSAAINAGITDTTGLSLGEYDILGNARIAGSAIDLGAYEFDNTSLPVTLIDFTGMIHNGNAYLKWETGLEINFNHFEIEKSTNRSVYKSIGVVAAKGNGSSYNFNTPQKEPTAYYRLKMVDKDGTVKHSRIIRLTQNAGEGISLYPNPAPDYINVQVSEPGTINIFSAEGRLVKQQYLREGVNIVDLSNFLPGIYFASMKDQQIKFIRR